MKINWPLTPILGNRTKTWSRLCHLLRLPRIGAGGLLCLFLSALSLAHAQTASVPPAQYGAWRSCRIGGGGYAQNVVLCPSDPKRCYAYIDVGGLYRSDDGGQTWRMLHGNLPARDTNYQVRGLVVDPRNADVLLIATGSQWANTPEGLYRSADGGATWKKTLDAYYMGNGDDRWAGLLLARDPKDPAVIVAASENTGVFRSADNGVTWKKLGLEGLHTTDLKFDKTNPRRLWLCALPYHGWFGGKMTTLIGGFYRSEDSGTTWTKLADTSPSEVLPDPVTANLLYGIVGNRVKLSGDDGNTWQDASEGLPAKTNTGYTSESSFQALAAGPDFMVTASTKGTFYERKRGENRWQKIERLGLEENLYGQPWFGAGGDHFGSALGSIIVDPRDPAHWFFTDWYSIYQTRDAGKHWRLTMDGVETTVLHCLTQDPSDPGVVHLGMADDGYFLSENGGVRFYAQNDISNNVKSISLSPALPSRLYAVGPQKWDWWANQVFVSIDRGRTWARSPMTGLPDMAAHHCDTIAADPNDPYAAYLCVSLNVSPTGGGVYKSIDGGKSWTWIGAGLPDGKPFFSHDIWNIGRELAVGADGTLIALSRELGQVFRYDTAQKRWTAAALTLHGAPYCVTSDLHTPGTFYLAVENDGIYKTADDGLTWKRVWTGSVRHVTVDAARPGRIAAGTSDGIILSTDGGATWKMQDKHLPYRVYNLVAFAGDRLLAGSAGSGAFWMPLAPAGNELVLARPAVLARVPSGASALPPLRNGSMTDGDAVPAGWNAPWSGSGHLALTRDTQTYHSTPASLRLESVGGTAYGSVSQSFDPALDPFTVQGWVKTSGKLEESLVAAQAFDKDGKQVAFVTLANAASAKEWQSFSGQVQLPRETAHWGLILTLKGNGQAWLDDVQFTRPPSVFLEK